MTDSPVVGRARTNHIMEHAVAWHGPPLHSAQLHVGAAQPGAPTWLATKSWGIWGSATPSIGWVPAAGQADRSIWGSTGMPGSPSATGLGMMSAPGLPAWPATFAVRVGSVDGIIGPCARAGRERKCWPEVGEPAGATAGGGQRMRKRFAPGNAA